MDLRDVTSSFALVIALATAGFTAYQQYFKKGRPWLYIGNRIEVMYGHEGRRILFIAPLAISNDGARPEVVDRMTASWSRVGSDEAIDFAWREFTEFREITENDRHVRRHSAVEWASIVVIPSRQAVQKSIQFASPDRGLWSANMASGHYRLEVVARARGGYARQAMECELSKTDVEKLLQGAADHTRSGTYLTLSVSTVTKGTHNWRGRLVRRWRSPPTD